MATYEPPTTPTSPSRTRATPEPSSFGGASAWPRWINILLGVWLFISAFVWPHTPSAATNTWIVGLLIVGVGIVSIYVPNVRWVNTALAIWLFISTLVIAHVTPATTWNNLIVAILVFVVSLTPSTGLSGGHPRHMVPAAGR